MLCINNKDMILIWAVHVVANVKKNSPVTTDYIFLF